MGQGCSSIIGTFTQPQLSNFRKSSIEPITQGEAEVVGPHVEVERFARAMQEMPHLVRLEVLTGAKRLESALGGIADLLRTENHADIDWKGGPIFDNRPGVHSGPHNQNTLEWKIPLAHGNESGEFPHKVLEMKSFALSIGLIQDSVGDQVWQNRAETTFGELEAVLSLWLSRLGDNQSMLSRNEDLYKRQGLHWRIVGVGSSSDSTTLKTLSQWTGCRMLAFKEGPGSGFWDTPWSSIGPTTCFGMHLIYPPEPPENGAVPTPTLTGDTPTPAEDVEYYVTRKRDTTLVKQCTCELIHLFIEAIAVRINAIGGEARRLSTEERRKSGSRVWEHPLLMDLAGKILASGVVETIEEGLELVVPSFVKHNLLPKEEPEE
ncbi:hypothetical protein F5144DRAFT_603357 [Chaetomium tenue]|uniref:Uncharacterized protein n=1 Tax=Chaetomium tenue TaxID=1854479 RepID=A0ACB7P9F0_9PEZI|nr:hypothetical protein F5144DRAFT_603357 [Chaetomium globosum]